jgi:hypothetical protein
VRRFVRKALAASAPLDEARLETMSDSKNHAVSSGTVWFIGWLFTIGFAKLKGWSIFFALFIWPYYLGGAVAQP